jgi:hypothetical protein
LVTKGQKILSEKIATVAKLNALPITETEGSDGTKFLDIEIDGDSEEVAKVVNILLHGVFDVSDSSKYELRYSGI